MNSLLRVMGEEVTVLSEGHPPYPHIIEEEDVWSVVVEGERVVRAAKLEEAIGLWSVSHYVLHQKTARSVRNTNWFIRTKIMKVHCEMDPDKSIVRDIEQWEKC